MVLITCLPLSFAIWQELLFKIQREIKKIKKQYENSIASVSLQNCHVSLDWSHDHENEDYILVEATIIFHKI